MRRGRGHLSALLLASIGACRQDPPNPPPPPPPPGAACGDGVLEQGELCYPTLFTPLSLGFGPEIVTTADFNQDGRPDIAVAGGFFSGAVFLQRADGSFEQRAFSTLDPAGNGGSGPGSIVSGDFNQDGSVDLITGNELTSDLAVLLGNGDGSFQQTRIIDTLNLLDEIVSGDVNNDGRLDIIAMDGGAVGVFLGQGNGTFQSERTSNIGAGVTLAVADLDGDGFLDVVNAFDFIDVVNIGLGNGDGTFQATGSLSVFSPSAIALADLNNDDIVDLAVTNELDDTVEVFSGNGDGTFDAPQSFATGSGAFRLQSVELNNDGAIDLVTADFAQVSVLFGNGDGTLSAATPLFMGQESAIALADLNGDETPELIAALEEEEEVRILVGEGGTFPRLPTIPVSRGPSFVSSADVNQDGEADLLSVSSGEPAINVSFGDGDGGFTPQPSLALPGSVNKSVVADFDGDATLDVVSCSFSQEVHVVLGAGGGTFAAPVQFLAASPFINALAAGDLNNDQASDLLLAGEIDNQLEVLLSNQDGTFTSAQLLPTGDRPEAVAVGDVNDDGNLDVIVANAFAVTLSLYLGSGDGTLQDPTTLDASGLSLGELAQLVVLDIDNDGDLDITTGGGDFLNHEIGIFSGANDGTFTLSGSLLLEEAAGGHGFADLDQDGALDLFLTLRGANRIELFLGEGSGAFAASPQGFAVGDRPESAIAVDLNNDQVLDLVTVNESSDDLGLLIAAP